ncbi:hypothetical protein CDIK_1981 [Cucumispora dikerogammari]|nr:hypothetical protein CDIK_1981 [Cucumispora dikerogammari]
MDNREDRSSVLNMLSSNSTAISAVPIENLIILTNSILKKIKKIDETNETLRRLNFRLKALIMAIKTYKIEKSEKNETKIEIEKSFEDISLSIKAFTDTINEEKSILPDNEIPIIKKEKKILSKSEIFLVIKSHLGSEKTVENNFLKRILNVLSSDFMSINDIMKKSGVAKFRVAEILNKCSMTIGPVCISKTKMADGTVGFNLKIN